MKCHDCGAEEGQYHLPNCDMERCPFCGGQLLSCNCCYEKLGLKDYGKNGTQYGGLTYHVYSKGLSSEQEEKWYQILEEKGRIPWVEISVLCRLCGEVYPEFFTEKDEDWNKYVIPSLQEEVLCRGCYDKMKKMFPNGWKRG